MTGKAPPRPLPADDATAGPPTGPAPWRLALVLGFAALVSGVLLSGLSMWFLGAVALAGLTPAAFTFNFHMPAALVRLFAVTRTAAKYGERIVGHRAALVDQIARRAGLFSAMAAAPVVRRTGWQLGNQDRLCDYLDDVEDVDYARLRAGLPTAVLVAGLAGLTAATLWTAPPAMLVIAGCAGMLIVSARQLNARAALDWGHVRSQRRAASRRLGSALAAVVPLQAEGSWRAVLGSCFAPFDAAEDDRLRMRRRQASFDFAAGLLGPIAALSVFATAWASGSRGDALLPSAFVAFAWLALGEPLQDASKIVMARVRERAARAGLTQWQAAALPTDAARGRHDATPRVLALQALPRRAPDGRRIGELLDAAFHAGVPTVVTGPSGCGKTSLLKQVAGWLGPEDDGRILADGVELDAAARQRLVFFGLHDAVVLSDTVRENLFAPDATDAECWGALAAVELDRRIGGAGGLDAWITQDMLSLGETQRLNLARAMLSAAPVVLLDEPAEHLDGAQAGRVLARLVHHCDGRILVFTSHHPDGPAGTSLLAL